MKRTFIVTRTIYFFEDGKYFTKKPFHKKYTKEHFRFFLDWQHRLLALSPITISLIFYLAEHMDDMTNEVTHNKAMIRRYQNFRIKIGKKPCSDSAVRKGFQQLKRNHVLISTPEIGNYIVNPIYMFKENDELRRICINKLLDNTKDINWSGTNLCEALGIY
jgi:hypothetical protein